MLSLYVFMADAIRVSSQGAQAIRNVLPTTFNWVLFLIALALMAAPGDKIINRQATIPVRFRSRNGRVRAGPQWEFPTDA